MTTAEAGGDELLGISTHSHAMQCAIGATIDKPHLLR